jgi:hypothetical protein
MAGVERVTRGLLVGMLLLTGCATTQPEWLRQEREACFRNRTFTEEIPRMYRGDPVHDPCWRFRPVLSDG